MAETGTFEFGDFRLDVDKSVLWRAGEIVPLSPKTLALLVALVERGGDVATKTELMGRVWPDTAVEEGNLTVLVTALRRGLGPRPDGGSFVQTVPRRGYRLDAPVRATGAPRRLGVAVLPFTVLDPKADSQTGLAFADALISRLTEHEALLVRPTLAVAHYARAPRPPREAAHELGVDAVLTGTIQRQGRRVRVSVQFVPRPTALKPWADMFEAEGADLFGAQDAVADGVARALWPRLAPPPPPSVRGPKRAPDAAREAYLRGRFFWSRFTPHGLGKAFAHFGEAVSLDPDYAAPHAGLADGHLLLGLCGLSPPTQAWEHAMECAERSLARDARHADAYAARAWARVFRDWDWTVAAADLDKAVALAPGRASALVWRGLFRILRRDLEGGRSDLQAACAIDPLSVVANAFQCLAYEVEGRHEEELELARRAVELRPDCFLGFRCVGSAQVRLGNAEAGLQALRRAVDLTQDGPAMRARLACALADTGDHAAAHRELDALDALSSTTFISPVARAGVLVALEETGAALGRLEEAAAARDGLLALLAVDPLFAPLRDHAAFRALLDRVGPRY